MKRVNGFVKEEVHERICSFGDVHIRLLLQSILDNHSSTWFGMLKDAFCGRDLFQLIENGKQEVAKVALEEMRGMHGTTRYPAQLFQVLYNQIDLDAEGSLHDIPPFCVDLPRVVITPLQLASRLKCRTGWSDYLLSVISSHRALSSGLVSEMRTAATSFLIVWAMRSKQGSRT